MGEGPQCPQGPKEAQTAAVASGAAAAARSRRLPPCRLPGSHVCPPMHPTCSFPAAMPHLARAAAAPGLVRPVRRLQGRVMATVPAAGEPGGSVAAASSGSTAATAAAPMLCPLLLPLPALQPVGVMLAWLGMLCLFCWALISPKLDAAAVNMLRIRFGDQKVHVIPLPALRTWRRVCMAARARFEL